MRHVMVMLAHASVWAAPIALLVAGGAYSLLLGNTLRFPDEQDYYLLAQNLIAHHSFTLDGVRPTAFRTPGYPLLLAALLLVKLPLIGLRFLNFIALALSAYLLQRILQQFALPVAAVVAPLLVLLYPVLFYTAGTLYPQTIGGTLLLLAILLAVRDERSNAALLLAGLVFGYLLLLIPNFLLKLPVFALALLLLRRERSLRAPLLVTVAALAVVGGWTVRNAVVLHDFVPLATYSGYNLLLGNSEHAAPNSGVNVDLSRYEAAAAGLDEVSRDRFYREQALDWLRENKPRAARLYVLKVLNYFNYRNNLYVASEGSRLRDLLMLATYGPLLLALVARLLLSARYRLSGLEWFLVVMYLASAFADAIFVTRIRFRLPLDLLLIGLVASFAETLYRTHLGRLPLPLRGWIEGRSPTGK